MARKNSATSWALLIVPVVVTTLLVKLLRPLQLLFAENNIAELVVYSGALGIGIFLFKRSRTVRDYEWRRQKAMDSVKSHIRAEDRGVWETNALVPTGLGDEGQSALAGSTGNLAGERETAEIAREEEAEPEIELLVEQEHVLKATRRVSGDDTYDHEQVESKTGVVRRASPMDRLIDWFSKRIVKKNKPPEEEITDAEKSTSDKNYSSSPLQSGEDSQGETVNAQTAEPEAILPDEVEAAPINSEMAAIYGSGGESIEALAGLTSAKTTSSYDPSGAGKVSSGYAINRCAGCGFSNPAETRYCEQCGATL